MTSLRAWAAARWDSIPRQEGSRDRLLASAFLIVLTTLLVGYMFLGRGFAHLGVPPIYVGEFVLLFGAVVTGLVLIRRRFNVHLSAVAWLLIGFMFLGVARTVPYLAAYGLDALRDAVLWGYGSFALMVYVLADRHAVLQAIRVYGWILPVFAIWLPISYRIFAILSLDLQPDELGSEIPIVFFKSGDMAVHIVGSLAFLVIAAGLVSNFRTLAWRAVLVVPVLWTTFIAGATNRGALLTFASGVVVVAVLAALLRRSRNWAPVLIAPVVLGLAFGLTALVSRSLEGEPQTAAAATLVAAASATASTAASPPVGDVVCATVSASLVENPGFEIGTINRDTIEAWETAAGLYRITDGDAYRGSNHAVIENTGEPWTAAITSERFEFEAGRDIAVSLRVKAIEGDPIVTTYVHWLDSSGAVISSPGIASLATEGRSGWLKSEGVLTAPEGTAYARVQVFESSGHAIVGVDEMIVKSGEFVEPIPVATRTISIDQVIENITSIFSATSDGGLEGSKEFRLRWWATIVDYTVFGDYFWTGKGFGVNLADADGFQANPDGSLRAPHNSHITALARMGVPGFLLWVVLQAAFLVGLVRAIVANKRAGALGMAVAGSVILAYWIAMMVDTSFDPYLEGPQGGIWFWTIFGLGMVLMRATKQSPNDISGGPANNHGGDQSSA